MSNWTHPVCGLCYDDLEPGREPVRLRAPEMESCCRCGFPTRAGIYYRANPRNMPNCPGHERDDYADNRDDLADS